MKKVYDDGDDCSITSCLYDLFSVLGEMGPVLVISSSSLLYADGRYYRFGNVFHDRALGEV